MRCFLCDGEVIWQSDFDYEDYGMDGDGIVHTYCCRGCNAFYEVYEDNTSKLLGEKNDTSD